MDGTSTAPSLVTRNVFVRSTLEKFVAERDVRRNKALFGACKAVLDRVKKSDAPSALRAAEYLEPYFIALTTRHAKVVSIALDGLEKLIGFGSLNGSEVFAVVEAGAVKSPDSAVSDDGDDDERGSGAGTVLVIEQIVEAVCAAYIPPRDDEKPNPVASQLEQLIVKVLITALSSPSAKLHGHQLLKAVRTVYNVYLQTKDKVSHTTLRLSLTQVVNLIFQRMEGYAQGLHYTAGEHRSELGYTAEASPAVETPAPRKAEQAVTQSAPPSAAVTEDKRPEAPASAPLPDEPEDDDSDEDDNNALRPNNGVARAQSLAHAETSTEPEEEDDDEPPTPSHDDRDASDAAEAAVVAATARNAISAAMLDATVIADESDEVQGGVAKPRVAEQEPGSSTPSRGSSASPMVAAASPLNRADPSKGNPSYGKIFVMYKQMAQAETNAQYAQMFNAQLQKDAYLVLRSLCKIANKPTTSTELTSQAVRSKILSLQLLLQILQQASSVFQMSDLFVAAIQKYLIVTMVSNAFNAVAPVFSYTLKIFHVLLTKFAAKLKYEIDVVFKEIFFKLLQSKNAMFEQKTLLLEALCKIVAVPQTLLEIYLNYDCDPDSLDSNLYERLVAEICKVAQMRLPPADDKGGLPEEYKLKAKALECVATLLQSLVVWGKEHGIGAAPTTNADKSDKADVKEAEEPSRPVSLSSSLTEVVKADNPEQFEQIKNMKHLLAEGITKFNFKPKKGVKFLLQHGLIKSETPNDIAAFMLHTVGLNKTAIGEYLGEGDDDIIPIMHAFVDLMDFSGLDFLGALRRFLNHFRLPGEAQKIDRFMLKFAERFVNNNPGVFANADTAYVLAYSVIMLNVDQHNPQVKKRMTKAEFIKNNRGINNNSDLPDEMLVSIFDDISHNELKMKDEEEKQGANTMALELGKMKDKRAAFAMESREILERTQALFKEGRRTTKTVFYSASRVEHIKPMFEVSWMAILVTVSAPLQDLDDPLLVQICLDAFLHAVHISCVFFMDLPKNAFLSTLVKYTGVPMPTIAPVTPVTPAPAAASPSLAAPATKDRPRVPFVPLALKPKNVAATRILLDAAIVCGNYFGSTWLDVLKMISQLERFKLLSEETMVQDIADSRLRMEGLKKIASTTDLDRSSVRLQEVSANQNFLMQVDRIFSGSRLLSGEAIVEFVRHLADVALSEINQPDEPRMYCLQKIVEISYYNMNRIRIEWSQIWAILGDLFNKVGCSGTTEVAYFAIDSLRQLSMKFLEKGELAHFQFQKDFLAPFAHVFRNVADVNVKELIVRCIQQMVFARASSIKSGWRVVMSVLRMGAHESAELIASMAYESVRAVFDNHFALVVTHGSFAEYVSTLVEFAKNINFPKLGLLAMDILVQMLPVMATMSSHQKLFAIGVTSAQTSLALDKDGAAAEEDVVVVHPAVEMDLDKEQLMALVKKSGDNDLQFWFPILYGLFEVTMSCELEIRTLACSSLFETLREHGTSLSQTFWDVIFRGVLLHIFDDLTPQKARAVKAREAGKIDQTEWISTTLIVALRSLVDLFTLLFGELTFVLESMMKLLVTCILQEDETIARIGLTCFVSMIKNNLNKLSDVTWERVMNTLLFLFTSTLPVQLLAWKPHAGGAVEPETPLSSQSELLDDQASISSTTNQIVETGARGSSFDDSSDHAETTPFAPAKGSTQGHTEYSQIMAKSTLQLLLIQTLNELMNTPPFDVYRAMSARFVLVPVECLERSYRFAHEFNINIPLRKSLLKSGFTDRLPNLLKQETYACSSYLVLLQRLFVESDPAYAAVRPIVRAKLFALMSEMLSYFDELNYAKLTREIAAWSSLVLFAVDAVARLPEDKFIEHVPAMYMPLVALLAHPLSDGLRAAIVKVFERVGTTFHIVKQSILDTEAATNERAALEAPVRASVAEVQPEPEVPQRQPLPEPEPEPQEQPLPEPEPEPEAEPEPEPEPPVLQPPTQAVTNPFLLDEELDQIPGSSGAAKAEDSDIDDGQDLAHFRPARQMIEEFERHKDEVPPLPHAGASAVDKDKDKHRSTRLTWR